MKVNLQTLNMRGLIPIGKMSHGRSLSPSYATGISADTFVKSQPVFKGESSSSGEGDIVKEGRYGLIKNLAVYARSCAYSSGRKIPIGTDINEAFRDYFLLCACSSSTYSPYGGPDKLPSKSEFQDILLSLYRESNGERGAEFGKYLVPEVFRKNEQERTLDIMQILRDDFARAIEVCAKEKYDIDVKDEQGVRDFAEAVYKDKTARTIKRRVSKDTQEYGRCGYYVKMLERTGSSAGALRLLDEKRDVFFSKPKSLEDRYDDYWRRIVNERWYAENAPDDTRSTFEIALDVANHMPW